MYYFLYLYYFVICTRIHTVSEWHTSMVQSYLFLEVEEHTDTHVDYYHIDDDDDLLQKKYPFVRLMGDGHPASKYYYYYTAKVLDYQYLISVSCKG